MACDNLLRRCSAGIINVPLRPLCRLLQVGIVLLALPLMAQSNSGELRLEVGDPHGLGVRASITLSNDAAQLHRKHLTDEAGLLNARKLPFGRYQLRVESEGFSPFSGILEIRSSLPTVYRIQLSIATMSTAVNVKAQATLLDPSRTASSYRIDQQAISVQETSALGRSVADLVQSQPGWVYEGSAVLH